MIPGRSAAPSGSARVDPRQPVPVGRDAAQHRAVRPLGRVHVDAVQVVARLLGRDRELRLVEQPPQRRRRAREVRLVLRARHDREVLARQGRQAEMRPPRPHVEPPGDAVVVELDHRPVRQLARDLVQRVRGDRRRAGAAHHRRRAVDHLDVEVGGAEADLVAVRLDQHVRQDRDGVAPLHHRLRAAHGPEKGAALHAEFHCCHRCRGRTPRSRDGCAERDVTDLRGKGKRRGRSPRERAGRRASA